MTTILRTTHKGHTISAHFEKPCRHEGKPAHRWFVFVQANSRGYPFSCGQMTAPQTAGIDEVEAAALAHAIKTDPALFVN
ncbi:hypothetical protein [Agrobacterium tumefaciens]|uniref:hypothetical protein n=1 Tax=Agrobacterium tumefaciens TaxID=358 RepID=UPI0015724092|nr:hypothetical protein [Agrobacterium tumefaciens]